MLAGSMRPRHLRSRCESGREWLHRNIAVLQPGAPRRLTLTASLGARTREVRLPESGRAAIDYLSIGVLSALMPTCRFRNETIPGLAQPVFCIIRRAGRTMVQLTIDPKLTGAINLGSVCTEAWSRPVPATRPTPLTRRF